MKVLVINAGSSSLKYQLFDMDNESILAKGLAERIGIEGSALTHQPTGGEKVVVEKPMPTHTEAIEMVLDALVDPEHGVISSMDEIAAVGHRVLHGGEKYSEPSIVNDDVIAVIKECFPLGPLHNPANLMGIEACMKVMPNVPMVAVFDTGFHQTMPPKAYLYGVDYKYYEKLKLRRYGFHGTSHRFVSLRMAEILGKDPSELKIVTCHLGNGSSIAAVDGGKVVDTSMGLTPLEGLLMGTRSGDMDPAVIQMIMHEEKCDIDEMLNILNKKSGLLGVSGVSSDMRDIEKAVSEGNQRAKWAREIFSHRVKKYIAAYAGVMGGVDVVLFTGGIGENDKAARIECTEGLGFMGIEVDPVKNDTRGKEQCISPDGAKVQVWVVPTNEELMIARDTVNLAFGK